MRRQKKKQLIQLTDTMLEAHTALTEAVQTGETLQITELLAGQQEAAIAVGNEIEADAEENAESVKMLETYCEMLWHAAQATEADVICDRLAEAEKLLGQIRDKLPELPEQKEIVFLPYKAGMWDCMESVWEAACADASCAVTVLPIPYFDLQDGQVKERHYEGGSFPPYVPVADYRKVSLEELQPDAVFVHNPFDNTNKLTSVLPQYYSNKLKEITRRLIYIPYFVANGAVYVTHRYLPSYENMDFIVAQCESMIDSFDQSIPRKKFLPFGSPIADRIIRLEKEKPPIPEAWKSMLPNGRDFGGCRTVMLNTSISMLMREGDRFLDKIEYLFQTVGRTEGVLIIWRPHPLLHTTAAFMGESYIRRLERLEKSFLENKIGILDQNPDVGVTVALCDAYVGETASSVVCMFGIAGKPRFYIDMKIPQETETEREEYRVDGYCRDDAKEYFLLDAAGWVVERKIGEGELWPLFRIPARECIYGRAYRRMELCDGRLRLYPDHAQGVLTYELQSGRLQKSFDGMAEFRCAEPSFTDRREEPEIVIRVSADSRCVRVIRAERFRRRHMSLEWYEDQGYCLTDFLNFLLTAEEQELTGNTGVYAMWQAYMDGSSGRRILQAVIKSLSEEK